MPVKKSKSMDKVPARRMPEDFEFPKTKKPYPKPMPKVQGAKPGVKKPMPKVAGAKPAAKTPAKTTPAKMPAAVPSKPIGDGTKKKVRVMPVTKSTPKTTKKAPATAPKKQQKMTPQDEAMKKILEKKYGKIYG
jgi:hypothetical protein